MGVQFRSHLRLTALLVGLVWTLGAAGCRGNVMEATPIRACAAVGQQCDRGHGVLGVCFDAVCAPGQAAPCFTCATQH